MALILLIPFFSEIITRHRKVYEVCTIGEKRYAVILKVSNDVLIQTADIEGDALTIFTDSCRYVSKTDIDGLAIRQFDHVIITEGKHKSSRE